VSENCQSAMRLPASYNQPQPVRWTVGAAMYGGSRPEQYHGSSRPVRRNEVSPFVVSRKRPQYPSLHDEQVPAPGPGQLLRKQLDEQKVGSSSRMTSPQKAVHSLPYSPSFVPVSPPRPSAWTPLPRRSEQAVDSPLSLGGIDIQPWIDAASEFSMNTDFDVSSQLRDRLREPLFRHASLGRDSLRGPRHLDLKAIMSIMKDESMGKRTIQALADKLMLQRMVSNLDIPQMPALLTIDKSVSHSDIEDLVNNHLKGPDCHQDIVIKPTHLSNGTGVILVTQPKPEEVESTIQFITAHIQQYMGQKAGTHESLALQSLKPGFIAQPKYQSAVGFKTPLELRVVVLWGRVRLALWWWGRGTSPGEFPQRNAWLVRKPSTSSKASTSSKDDCLELTDKDEWQFIHDHEGSNPGFEKALELFQRNIDSIATAAEALAVAVGAPFLRADFFVGSPKWGVRLNEVAYGCGCEYRSIGEDSRTVDDAPNIAQIFQEGMSICKRRMPAQTFLTRLGVTGYSYADMEVTSLPAWVRPALPEAVAALGQSDEQLAREFVPEELCRTIPRYGENRQTRSRSWDEGPARRLSTDLVVPLAGSSTTRSSSLTAAHRRLRMPVPSGGCCINTGGPCSPTGGPCSPTGGPCSPIGGPCSPTGGPCSPTGLGIAYP